MDKCWHFCILKTDSQLRFVKQIHSFILFDWTCFLPFLHLRKKVCAIRTLPFVKTVGPKVCKRETLIMLMSKVTVAVETWVFCSLTRHARLFIPTNLVTNLYVRKRSDAVSILKKGCFIPLSAPEWDPTPCGCWGQMSLKTKERIAKLLLYLHVPLP